MGQDISTFQNVTYAKHNKNYLVKMSYQMPFTDYTVFSENFVFPNGSIYCTNFYEEPFCYRMDYPQFTPLLLDINESYFSSLNYYGAKEILNTTCDIIYGVINVSKPDFNIFNTTVSIKNAEFYACIDRKTGIYLESMLLVNTTGFIDMSYNLTELVNSIDYNVNSSMFELPYQIISEEEFLNLLNETA